MHLPDPTSAKAPLATDPILRLRPNSAMYQIQGERTSETQRIGQEPINITATKGLKKKTNPEDVAEVWHLSTWCGAEECSSLMLLESETNVHRVPGKKLVTRIACA
jgi:hypothetical protein